MIQQLHYWVFTPKITDVVRRRAICTPVFIAAMSILAKLWKKPRCPSGDEWIKKMWSIYTMEYYSAIRRDEYPPFAFHVDGTGGDYAK